MTWRDVVTWRGVRGWREWGGVARRDVMKWRGGNFDIILWTFQVNLKFHGVGILLSSYPCGLCQFEVTGRGLRTPCQFEVTWASGILIAFHPCGQSNEFKVRGENVDIILSLWTFQANSWEREFWYHHTLVDTPRQFEVSWGWESWYHFTLVDIPCSCGWESSYPCEHAKSVWSSIGVEDLISSYPCEHAKSIWSSIGMGSLISSYSCGQPNSISNSMHVEL